MLSPRLTYCPECASIPALIAEIDCKLANVTGPDIIFFWVARMVMANMEFMKGTPRVDGRPRSADEELVPFRNVYFTSLVRDEKGRKLSKSLGNSPDPLDVIKEYGADGLRFTITYLAPIGQDVIFSLEKCEIGRNFANKVWNAGRFLLMNKAEILGENSPVLSRLPEEHCDLADRWILSRLNHAIERMNSALEDFQINAATKILYSFLWHDFCDWYVEIVKTRLYGNEPSDVKQTPGYLVPLTNGDLMRWSLAHGLRIFFVVSLVALGIYQEPRGAYLPSVGY